MSIFKSKKHIKQDYSEAKQNFTYDDARSFINKIIAKGSKSTVRTLKGDIKVAVNTDDLSLTIGKKRYTYNKETKTLKNNILSLTNELVNKKIL